MFKSPDILTLPTYCFSNYYPKPINVFIWPNGHTHPHTRGSAPYPSPASHPVPPSQAPGRSKWPPLTAGRLAGMCT